MFHMSSEHSVCFNSLNSLNNFRKQLLLLLQVKSIYHAAELGLELCNLISDTQLESLVCQEYDVGRHESLSSANIV